MKGVITKGMQCLFLYVVVMYFCAVGGGLFYSILVCIFVALRVNTSAINIRWDLMVFVSCSGFCVSSEIRLGKGLGGNML